jgi:hypothetical protein
MASRCACGPEGLAFGRGVRQAWCGRPRLVARAAEAKARRGRLCGGLPARDGRSGRSARPLGRTTQLNRSSHWSPSPRPAFGGGGLPLPTPAFPYTRTNRAVRTGLVGVPIVAIESVRPEGGSRRPCTTWHLAHQQATRAEDSTRARPTAACARPPDGFAALGLLRRTFASAGKRKRHVRAELASTDGPA